MRLGISSTAVAYACSDHHSRPWVWARHCMDILIDHKVLNCHCLFLMDLTYSKLYRESGPNKMAPLASIVLEREQ